jgi:tetratricopeptide repeat protein 8
LLREAEQQFRSSIRAQPNVTTYLELCNVYLRLDLPNTALDVLTEASYVVSSLPSSSHTTLITLRNKFSVEPRFLLGIARIYDALNDPNNAIEYYKKVLALDSSNVESIACLGAHFFYSDQVPSPPSAPLPQPDLHSPSCLSVISVAYCKWE